MLTSLKVVEQTTTSLKFNTIRQMVILVVMQIFHIINLKITLVIYKIAL